MSKPFTLLAKETVIRELQILLIKNQNSVEPKLKGNRRFAREAPISFQFWLLGFETAGKYTDPLSLRESHFHKTDPKNYHPVSLTCVVSVQNMEYIICSQMMHHLEANNILTENQFGF